MKQQKACRELIKRRNGDHTPHRVSLGTQTPECISGDGFSERTTYRQKEPL